MIALPANPTGNDVYATCAAALDQATAGAAGARVVTGQRPPITSAASVVATIAAPFLYLPARMGWDLAVQAEASGKVDQLMAQWANLIDNLGTDAEEGARLGDEIASVGLQSRVLVHLGDLATLQGSTAEVAAGIQARRAQGDAVLDAPANAAGKAAEGLANVGAGVGDGLKNTGKAVGTLAAALPWIIAAAIVLAVVLLGWKLWPVIRKAVK